MNHGPLLFLGVFLAMVISWCGMIVAPHLQLGNQQPETIQPNVSYPTTRAGMAQQGLEIYRANGCYYCHTQVVRPGADLERGWGPRFTVAQDYLYERPVMLGAARLGPDLANMGLRQPDETWHLVHLYDPTIVVPGSTMPRYPYLFEKRKIGRAPSPNALPNLGKHVEEGYEVIPKAEAYALTAYLMSLQATAPVFEAPPPAPPEGAEATEGGTNQMEVPEATNAPATSTPQTQ